MNTILKTARYRHAQIASSALVVSAAALAVSGLLAQSAPKQSAPRLEATRKGPCQDWSDTLKKDPKKVEKLRRTFVTALKRSARILTPGTPTPGDVDTRKELLNSSASARDEILRIFKQDTSGPIFDPDFPAEAWFKFYEPELPITKEAEKTTTDPFREDHCLHIFRLPEPGTQLSGVSDEVIFETYLMCCYKPW
jgi:hypothetical protein